MKRPRIASGIFAPGIFAPAIAAVRARVLAPALASALALAFSGCLISNGGNGIIASKTREARHPGLPLGITKEEVIKLWGHPTSIGADRWVYMNRLSEGGSFSVRIFMINFISLRQNYSNSHSCELMFDESGRLVEQRGWRWKHPPVPMADCSFWPF